MIREEIGTRWLRKDPKGDTYWMLTEVVEEGDRVIEFWDRIPSLASVPSGARTVCRPVHSDHLHPHVCYKCERAIIVEYTDWDKRTRRKCPHCGWTKSSYPISNPSASLSSHKDTEQ